MKVEYKYRRVNERKKELEPVIARKEEKKIVQVLAKGGSMSTGRWTERKPGRYVDAYQTSYYLKLK